MAIMIPNVPFKFDAASLEGEIFNSFAGHLDAVQGETPYYVFHSYKMGGVCPIGEVDFVIYHRQKGILCVEAKAGQVIFEDRVWKYGKGVKIHGGAGPYRQAEEEKWSLMRIIDEKIPDLSSHFFIGSCVLFQSLSIDRFRQINLDTSVNAEGLFGPENNRAVTLTKECLYDPSKYIGEMMDRGMHAFYKQFRKQHTPLTVDEERKLFGLVLCPKFSVFISKEEESDDLQDLAYLRYTDEQCKILGFLEQQNIVAINGRAGTGKTVVALERAKMMAKQGNKVLFLCYNRNLKEYLSKKNGGLGIDFMTLDELALKYNATKDGLADKLISIGDADEFGYRHVVVDEGQDFVYEGEECDVLSAIQMLVTPNGPDSEGSFYVFYDKLQLIQGGKRLKELELPPFISEADHITLHRNCRNTLEIAKTSLRPWNLEPTMFGGSNVIPGLQSLKPEMKFLTSGKSLETVLAEEMSADKDLYPLNKTVIISCGKVLDNGSGNMSAVIGNYDAETQTYKISHNGQKLKCGCYTARRFKGLEAEKVILIDFKPEMFADDSAGDARLFYVAATRARKKLVAINTMSADKCRAALKLRGKTEPPNDRQAMKFLAREMKMECFFV